MRNTATHTDTLGSGRGALLTPGPAGRFGGRVGLTAGALLLVTLVGCGRTLTILQAEYINTASQENRLEDRRTGEPLELAIVCVYPDDLEKAANNQLRPDQKVTSEDWFKRRPTSDGSKDARFDLPADQIYVLTNDSSVYGRHIGKALRGSKLDQTDTIHKTGIQFKGGWVGGQYHDADSVIYVFAKFIGSNGEVLPVLPAKFNPPGAYTEDLEVRIGVDPDTGRRLADRQFIKVQSERKLHRD